jgi:hypothetical protein
MIGRDRRSAATSGAPRRLTVCIRSLSYRLRKLVFRGAWIDHRVKAGLLDVSFDEDSGSFAYRMPSDQTPVLELAPVPSWASLAYVTE